MIAVETHLSKATAHHQAGEWHEAERLYHSILAIDPEHPDTLHQLGALAHQTGRNDIAISLVGQAIKRIPSRAVFHNTLGSAMLASGDAPGATAAFERAVQLNPQSVEMRNNLANALLAEGRLDNAIEIYIAILEIAPSHADVHNNLGFALQIKGRADEAISHFQAALAARPNDSLALTHLGNALCDKGYYQDAAEACRQAVALRPGLASAHANLGNALFGQRRYEDACDAYCSALALAPDLLGVHKSLGIAHHLLGRLEQADACFARARTLNPAEDLDVALGHIYYTLGRLEEAVAAYRRAHERVPDNPETLFALGGALNELGRHGEGLAAIAEGPGLTHLSLRRKSTAAWDAKARRTHLRGNTPHFIGSWSLKDTGLCEHLINFFEQRAAHHTAGRTNSGTDLAVKKSTDLVIFPKDVESPGFEAVGAYLRELEACWCDYTEQWVHLAEVLPSADLVPFKIQRYGPGDHFQKPHCERIPFGSIHRVLAWMTYLNDVEDGGLTRFHHYGIEVKPRRGLTLIWPAEWTHVHAGRVVKAGRKYIITGWMHFPHPQNAMKSSEQR